MLLGAAGVVVAPACPAGFAPPNNGLGVEAPKSEGPVAAGVDAVFVVAAPPNRGPVLAPAVVLFAPPNRGLLLVPAVVLFIPPNRGLLPVVGAGVPAFMESVGVAGFWPKPPPPVPTPPVVAPALPVVEDVIPNMLAPGVPPPNALVALVVPGAGVVEGAGLPKSVPPGGFAALLGPNRPPPVAGVVVGFVSENKPPPDAGVVLLDSALKADPPGADGVGPKDAPLVWPNAPPPVAGVLEALPPPKIPPPAGFTVE